MADAYRLLIDTHSNSFVEPIMEQANKDEPKKMYLEGVFAESGVKNKNGRIYDIEEMRKDVERFNVEKVKQGRSCNEMEHPSNPSINYERVCDRTVELRMESDGTVYGKALILDTPMGRLERSLVDGGVRVGKSSRALGQLTEKADGNHVTGMHIVCHDSVEDPSCIKALVDPLMENREWIIGSDGNYMPMAFDKLTQELSTLPKHNREEYFLECFQNLMKTIKG
jgi:hypothetical protein